MDNPMETILIASTLTMSDMYSESVINPNEDIINLLPDIKIGNTRGMDNMDNKALWSFVLPEINATKVNMEAIPKVHKINVLKNKNQSKWGSPKNNSNKNILIKFKINRDKKLKISLLK